MERFKARWRQWVGISYLSPFERLLNRALWAFALVSLAYSLVQHVFLANVSEVFRGGARMGDLLYDLAIAYIGAFLFYLLVVRMPLRQDRRKIWAHLDPLLGRVAGSAAGLIQMLNEAAGFDTTRENTKANVSEVCQKIGPMSRSNLGTWDYTPGQPVQYHTVFEAMDYHISQARKVNRQILDQSTYLSTDIISLVNAIEQGNLFKFTEAMSPMIAAGRVGNKDMTIFAEIIFEYLSVADRLDKFRREFVAGRAPQLSRLVRRDDDADNETPLFRFVEPQA